MSSRNEPRRLVVGVTGASGPQWAIGLLRAVRDDPTIQTHLVMSRGAHRTIGYESSFTAADVAELADVVHRPDDLGAAVASGSFATIGMVVVPCSMKTLSGIATGFSDNLVARAADVTLKERRPLVIVPRETPLSLIHLRNMVTVTEAGALVFPPVPAFYHRPTTIDDLVAHTVGRILEQFGIKHDLYVRWTGPRESSSSADGGPANPARRS